MEENGINQLDEGWVNLDTNQPSESEDQPILPFDYDPFNGNNLLRQLLADEISEGM